MSIIIYFLGLLQNQGYYFYFFFNLFFIMTLTECDEIDIFGNDEGGRGKGGWGIIRSTRRTTVVLLDLLTNKMLVFMQM